jgi:hypothetical protein
MKIGQFSDSFLPIVDGVGRVVFNYAMALSRWGGVLCGGADGGHGFSRRIPFELVDFISMELPRQRQYSTGIPSWTRTTTRACAASRWTSSTRIPLHRGAGGAAARTAAQYSDRRHVPLALLRRLLPADAHGDARKPRRGDHRQLLSALRRGLDGEPELEGNALRLRYVGEIVVMPNGTPDIDPSPKRAAAARARFSLPDEPILLYCGR